MNANANIENRVIKTTAVSFLSTGLSIIIQLISVPICLRYWGKTMYGTWLAISAAFTMLRTIDGGYTSYVGNELNILYHKDQDYMKKIMASGVWGVAAIGLFQLLIVLFLYYFQSMGILIGNTAGTTLTAKNAGLSLLIMIVTWTFVCSYTGILHRFLIPVGMLYQLLWWMLFLQLAQSFALILAAYMQVDVIMAAIFFAVSQAIVYLSSAIYIRCKLPKFYPWLKNTDMKIGLKEIFNSLPMTINGFVQQIGNSGLVVLISAILGAAMVPIYSTMRTLSNLWTTVTNIVTAPLLPDIVRYHSTNEHSKFLMVHRVHTLLMSVIVNLSLLVAYPLIDKVYLFWTRGKLPLNKPLMLLLMASVSIYALNSLFNTFLTGLNERAYLVFSGVIRGGVFFLSYLLLYFSSLGIAGIGWAVFLAELVLLIVNSKIYMQKTLKSIGANEIRLFAWYNYLCFGTTVGFLIVSAYLPLISWWWYMATVLCLILGVIFSWNDLNLEVKTRILRIIRVKR